MYNGRGETRPCRGVGEDFVDYAQNYERCCLDRPGMLQRAFIGLAARRARAIGQRGHKIWSLKYVMDAYFEGRDGIKVMDCGAWNGWFLSYDIPAIAQRIALDFDAHFAGQLRAEGIDFLLADMEKGCFPVATDTLDLVAMTSTLEHLSSPEHVAGEIRRVLKPGGVCFVTVPDIMKYKFHFWDDVTHKRPFNRSSLAFLFQAAGMETLELGPYNHDLFIASMLLPRAFRRPMTRFRAKALLYVGRKPEA